MNNIFQVNEIKSSMGVEIECIGSINQEIRSYQDELKSLIVGRYINPVGITLEHRILNTTGLNEEVYKLADKIIRNKIKNGL